MRSGARGSSPLLGALHVPAAQTEGRRTHARGSAQGTQPGVSQHICLGTLCLGMSFELKKEKNVLKLFYRIRSFLQVSAEKSTKAIHRHVLVSCNKLSHHQCNAFQMKTSQSLPNATEDSIYGCIIMHSKIRRHSIKGIGQMIKHH